MDILRVHRVMLGFIELLHGQRRSEAFGVRRRSIERSKWLELVGGVREAFARRSRGVREAFARRRDSISECVAKACLGVRMRSEAFGSVRAFGELIVLKLVWAGF